MSLTISFLTFDLSILVLIHGLFTLIFLRRLFFDIFGKLLLYPNTYLRLEKYLWKEKRTFSKNLVDEREMIMGSVCPRKIKAQDIDDTDGIRIDPRKGQILPTNSTDSASVQAKISLDLIVEQLNREMSLKNIKDREHQRMELRNSMAMDDEGTGPKDLFGIVFEKDTTKIDQSRVVEKETVGVPETIVPIEVNVISMNLKELEEKGTREEVGRTILPVEPVVKSYGREEENLYGLIRSMIAEEVKRYEERERKFLRKVHSDTSNLVGRKTNKRMFLFFNKESSSRDIKKEKKEEINLFHIPKYYNLKEQNLKNNRTEKDKNVGFPSTFALEGEKSFDLPAEERRINEGEKTLTRENSKDVEKESKEIFTQTERAYMIRATRSCPLRKRGIYRGVLSDARHKAELLERIHRKASDNLIYEKGKASGSPSYVPLTERFRWRYVGPKKAR